MSPGSTGACSRPRRSVRSRSRRLLQQRRAVEVGRAREDLHLRVGLRARAPRSRRVVRATRRAARSGCGRSARPCRPRSRSSVVPSMRSAADRTADELRVVVDETDDDRVAERAPLELERERDARSVAPTMSVRRRRVRAVTLTLEREQPGLEPDAAAAEQDEQRGDRRRGEQRERHVAYVGVPGELERRDEDAGRRPRRRREPLPRPTRSARPGRRGP